MMPYSLHCFGAALYATPVDLVKRIHRYCLLSSSGEIEIEGMEQLVQFTMMSKTLKGVPRNGINRIFPSGYPQRSTGCLKLRDHAE